jgi:hypothetical protein
MVLKHSLITAMKFKFISKLALFVGAAFALASCSMDDGDNDYYYQNPATAAYGIVANASPNSGDLYFFADSNQVNNTGLSYTGADGYFNFFPGNRVLSIKDQAGTTLATDTIALTAGQYFSAFAVNTFNSIELVTYRDSLTYPPANQAYVRFINLSPDADSVSVATPTQVLATGVAFKQATPFIAVPSGTYSFDFTLTGSEDSLFTGAPVNLYSGHIYTIYTKGFATPATGSNDTFSTELLRNY